MNNISAHVRCSYLSILLDDSADIFAASMLTWYSSLSFLILSSLVMISFYFHSINFLSET